MPHQTYDGEEYEESGSGYVCPAQERILATYPGDGGNDDRLCSAKLLDGEVYEKRKKL